MTQLKEIDLNDIPNFGEAIRTYLSGPNLDLLLWHLCSKRSGIINAPQPGHAKFYPLAANVLPGASHILTIAANDVIRPTSLLIHELPLNIGLGEQVVTRRHWTVEDIRCGSHPIIESPGPLNGDVFGPDQKHGLRFLEANIGQMYSFMVRHDLKMAVPFMGILIA